MPSFSFQKKISPLAIVFFFLFLGCRKNEVEIEERVEDITPFLKITVNGETENYTPFSAECDSETFNKLGVTNNPDLLMATIDLLSLEVGDFRLEIFTFETAPNFGFTYRIEDTVLGAFIDDENVSYEEDSEIFSGQLSGVLVDLDTNLQYGDFLLEFRAVLEYDESYCE